jgi:hypothetical protein
MNEPGMVIPPPYDDPANWPYRLCTYEDARGWLTRIRNGDTAKAIAKETGISFSSVRRAVVWYLHSIGQYDPESWFAYKHERRAEGRRWWRAKMDQRDQEQERVGAEIRQARERSQAEREARERAEGELHIASSYSDDSARRERRRQLQRALNAKKRPQAGF